MKNGSRGEKKVTRILPHPHTPRLAPAASHPTARLASPPIGAVGGRAIGPPCSTTVLAALFLPHPDLDTYTLLPSLSTACSVGGTAAPSGRIEEWRPMLPSFSWIPSSGRIFSPSLQP
ncbi:hypothetical protein D1007_31444 [Hordeum vulgare]|nr:hypothetical protein D1007_31444 [Hordeum vulgare]